MTAVAVPSRERPILFSGEMVRAILEGRKTQTRRVITDRKMLREDDRIVPDHGVKRALRHVFQWWTNGRRHWRCSYGQPGDRLWVRETAWYDREVIPAVGMMRCFFEGGDVRMGSGSTHRAPGGEANSAEVLDLNDCLVRRPSIHMPRWASRLTLEITEVRIERLQEVTEEDAIAEGFEGNNNAATGVGYGSNREAFCCLWNDLNAKRGSGWDKNPWVWVLAFRRVPS